jgi:hypothetical protein
LPATDCFLAFTLLPGFLFCVTLFDEVLNLPSRLDAGLSPLVFCAKAGIAKTMINSKPMILKMVEKVRILLFPLRFKKYVYNRPR